MNKLDENLFISPFSVSLALAMTLTGARNETALQLKNLLDLNLKDSEISEIYNEYLTTLDLLNSEISVLNVANRIYSQSDFKLNLQFEDNLAKNFKSDIKQIDFSNSADSAETINKWVSNKTNHKINKIIEESSLNSLTRLILINAIYFKSSWKNPFIKELTKYKDFFLSNGLKTKVEMMKIKDKPFRIKANPAGLNAMTCELPYKNNQISMTIILPNKETSIEKLEKSLTLKHLKEIYSSSIPVSANVQVPKFNITFHSDVIFLNLIEINLNIFKYFIFFKLSEKLKQMGATLPFDSNNADLTGICDTNEKCQLAISKVMHQTFISNDENGTEAAAATAVQINYKSFIRPSLEYKCDRPFLFIIHETIKNGILFIGKFMNNS